MGNLIKLVVGVFISAILRVNAAFAIVVIGGMFGVEISISHAVIGILAFSIASIKYDDHELDTSAENIVASSVFCLVMPWVITLTAFLVSLFI